MGGKGTDRAIEGRQKRNEARTGGSGRGVEPESEERNMSPKVGELAPDFDFKFGGMEATVLVYR